jgi:hypothetical protein
VSRPEPPPCPHCLPEESDLDCESVDVGVGIIYGPWYCNACGWSELGTYEERQRNVPAGWYQDRGGNLINKERERSEIQTGLARLGLPTDLADHLYPNDPDPQPQPTPDPGSSTDDPC